MKLEETKDRVAAASGVEMLERLLHLDRVEPMRVGADAPPSAPMPGDAIDFDVVLAGGGLSLLFAPLLARRGLRVAVVERARAGDAHREWNASRPELAALSDTGLFTAEEIDRELVVARYREGVCRWHGGGTYRVRGVLDCAVDAKALLSGARTRAEQAGVRFIDRTTVVDHRGSRAGVRLSLRGPQGEESELSARLMLEGRGASSAMAAPDLICPTVGGVLTGLAEGDAPDEMDPQVGEILATTEHAVGGRQCLWEAFPGRRGETTVYLFHYALAETRRPGMLLELYGKFFEELGHYKRGTARLLRPTFGVIPGWSRLTPSAQPKRGPVLLVGDAAALHSPLTFCGFGAMLRSLRPVESAVLQHLEGRPAGDWREAHPDRAIHLGTGALARVMTEPGRLSKDPAALNALLDAAFGTLEGMGNESFGALLRDELPLPELVTFLRRTSQRRPSVYVEVVRALGLSMTASWGARLLPGLLAAP